MQMLQYYPNLLTSQPPPPLTDAEFSRLPSVTVSCDALGACSGVLHSLRCRFVDHSQHISHITATWTGFFYVAAISYIEA